MTNGIPAFVNEIRERLHKIDVYSWDEKTLMDLARKHIEAASSDWMRLAAKSILHAGSWPDEWEEKDVNEIVQIISTAFFGIAPCPDCGVVPLPHCKCQKPSSKLMVSKSGDIHEECPDCRGECSPIGAAAPSAPTATPDLDSNETWKGIDEFNKNASGGVPAGWEQNPQTSASEGAEGTRPPLRNEPLAAPTATDWMRQILDSEEFYDLMQAYRHAPLVPQQPVLVAFEQVKQFILAKYAGEHANG